jgi:predicted dehydrogenase
LVLQALAQGQDVLVEKPLCHSLEELEAIAARATNRTLSVCQTLRLDPAVRLFRESNRAGQLGRLTRLNLMHHARHALAESEWVTNARPDGILFENAIHFVDLAHQIFEATSSFSVEGVRFYEAGNTGVLTGFEALAADTYGRHITFDFMQDSLRHSAIQTRVLIGGTAADGEMRFYPSSFRTLSGVQDPIHELAGEIRRLAKFVGATLRPKKRNQPHLELMQDLLDASKEKRPTQISIDSVRPTIAFLQDLSRRWLAQQPIL